MTLRPMAIPTALQLVRDDGQVSHRRRKVAGVGRGLAVPGSQDVRDGDRPEIPDPPAQPTDDQDPNPDGRRAAHPTSNPPHKYTNYSVALRLSLVHRATSPRDVTYRDNTGSLS